MDAAADPVLEAFALTDNARGAVDLFKEGQVKSFLIAAVISVVASGVLVFFSCHGHAGDSCYLMQGASPYIAVGLLIVLWPLVAGVRIIIRAWKQPPPEA
jgi:hypothetical protein